MLFSITTTVSSEKLTERIAAIPAHRAYLASRATSVLAVGTTFDERGDLVGSTYLLEAGDWNAGRNFIAEDPMTASGARQSIDILEWRMGGFDRRYPWKGAEVAPQEVAGHELNRDEAGVAHSVSSRARHLRVLLLIATLSPLVALVNTILGDAIAHLPVLLRAFLVVGLVVPAASYIILPLLTDLASFMQERRETSATIKPLPERTRST